MQDVTVARFQIIFLAITLLFSLAITMTRKIVQCYCVHRAVYTVKFQSATVTPADITKEESALYSSYVLRHLGTAKSVREYGTGSPLY
jgi:hypothetical protein